MHRIVRQFLKALQLEKCEVVRPRRTILLCGGKTDRAGTSLPSVREYLLRRFDDRKSFKACDILLAEDVNDFLMIESPRNLIQLERWIASVCELVIVIVESSGSIAELGAFSQIQEIAERMLVIVNSSHHPAHTFISRGPIEFMRSEHSGSVGAFDWKILNEGTTGQCIDYKSLDLCAYDMLQFITERIGVVPKSQKVDSERDGHRMLLIAGLILALRGASLDELMTGLRLLGVRKVSREETGHYLFCLQGMGWITKRGYMSEEYYFPLFSIDCINYAYREDAKIRDNIRWKYAIVQAYEKANDARTRLFQSVLGSLKA